MKQPAIADVLKNIVKIPFLRNFLLLLIIVVIAFPLFTHFFVIIPFKSILLENIEDEAMRTASHLKKMYIGTENWELNIQQDKLFHLKILETLEEFKIIKLKIFSKYGDIIYSSDLSEVGEVNKRDYFLEIVAKGNIFTKIVKKDSYTLENRIMKQDVAEIYVPIMLNKTFNGAFEIYYDITQKSRKATFQQIKTVLALTVLLVILVVCVVLTLIKGSLVSISKDKVENDLSELNDSLMTLVQEQTREILVTQKTSVETLAKMAEHNDRDTGTHLKRIQMYVRILSENLAEDSLYSDYIKRDMYIDDMVFASILHDIGKTAVPESILNKPGRLTESEFQEIKKHTVVAGELLDQANKVFVDQFNKDSYFALARDIAKYHHEKWDGSGYPEGLTGNEIPLCARIVALADVYDALMSERPYKKPWSHEKAFDEILSSSETHFDPEIVQAFENIADQFREISEKHNHKKMAS